MALASQSLVTEWLLARSILGKKFGTRTKREVDTIVPWLRNRGDLFSTLPKGQRIHSHCTVQVLKVYAASAVVCY